MNQHNSLLAESITTKLSLAVYMTDDYQQGKVMGTPEILLKDLEIRPVKNQGGYYLFLDLSGNNYSVQIKGGEYYFDNESENIDLGELDALHPVVNILLKPTPSYPFQPFATLIRGCVVDSLNKGISGALLSIKKTEIETQTTTTGEFVIYFRGLNDYEVEIEDGKRMVKIDGKNPELHIEHPDYRNNKGKVRKKKVTVEVEERKTTSISFTYP